MVAIPLDKINYNIPYSWKFSLGSYFRDFADCIRNHENKNRNNLFQQKLILSNFKTSIYRVFKRIKFVCYYCWLVEGYDIFHSRLGVCIFEFYIFVNILQLVFVYCTAQLDRSFCFLVNYRNIQTFTACVAYGTL